MTTVRSVTRVTIRNFVLLALLFLPFLRVGLVFTGRAESVNDSILKEGRDFATLNLRDPWDLAEFSDISQGLNISGGTPYIDQIEVIDGVLSARSTSVKDAQLFALWPGFNTMMSIGKVGHRFPIPSADFSCLYIAMKVYSGPPDNQGSDVFQVYWFADQRLNYDSNAAWGFSKGIKLFPEAGGGAPIPIWKLYQLNLADPNNYWGGTAWSAHPTWKGLRIDPTIQVNVNFELDWIRLTDCHPVTKNIQWTSSGSVSIWLRPVDADREIQVAEGITGRSYDLDLQGVPPGGYEYLVKEGGRVLATGNITINQTPIVVFDRPSSTSGVDFATNSGNPWDMTDWSDLPSVECTHSTIKNSILSIDTPPIDEQPRGCVGGTSGDPKIYLNTPVSLDTHKYRYLSFRLNTDWPWQDVGKATIARWVWSIQGTSGREGYRCHIVSQDIPYDVGWQIYSVDLYDAFNGSAEARAGECPGGDLHWFDTTPVLEMRFDPNENISDNTLHQELDWILLTQVDRVSQGRDFIIKILLNKPSREIIQTTYYYTDNLQDPKQHLITSDLATIPETATAGSNVYLPLVVHDRLSKNEFQMVYFWDTSRVPMGEYYICVNVEDAFNQAIYCSETPVQVTAP